MTNKEFEELYNTIIDSKSINDALSDERLSISFLKRNGLKVRLIHDLNLLEAHNIFNAFSRSKFGFFLSKENEFKASRLEWDTDDLWEKLQVSGNSNAIIITDQSTKNFVLALNDAETIWLIGNREFLEIAQPYPLSIMKSYYLGWYDLDDEDLDSESFWGLWNAYENLMLN